MISAICLFSGRLARLRESLACWEAQDFDGERELIILNAQPRQRLLCDVAGVRIVTAPRPMMPPQARNFCIEQARGDVIVSWPEDDYCLPSHLKNIADAITGNAWIWMDKEFLMERGEIRKVVQSGPFSFAFTREAWRRVGKYGAGVNGASDRNFIGKVTSQFKGEKVALNPRMASFIRCGGEAEKRAAKRMVTSGDAVLAPDAGRDYPSMVNQFFGVKSDKKIAVVMLGRNGDIINLLPVIKIVSERYRRPDVIVAREFLPLFDGVSYANPVVMAEKEEDLGNALIKAKREYEIVLNCQVWGKGFQGLKTVGSYNMESWKLAGMLHRFEDQGLRPVFDRRDQAREAALIASISDTGKPWLLVNLTSGKSSPCKSCGSLMPSIIDRFGGKFQIVDLALIRAERLYDCIALYEKASAMCCIDTAHLHLVAATDLPTVALVNENHWAATIMRSNCVEEIPYDAATPERVISAIESAVNKSLMEEFCDAAKSYLKDKYHKSERCETLTRRIFHIVDRFTDTDSKNLERKKVAQASWDQIYESGQLIPAHLWDVNYPRNSKDAIGDTRKLCYMKDLFKQGMDQADDDDILLFTNDDNAILPSLPEYLKFHVSVYGPCSIFRTEFRGVMASLDLDHEKFAKSGVGKHIGRDGFAFTKRWLAENWNRIPDAIISASMWDIHMAALIRLEYGIVTTTANIGEQIYPAEIPNGFTGHLQHHSAWNVKNAHLVPSNLHNGKLFKEFAEKYLPNLRVTAEGNLA